MLRPERRALAGKRTDNPELTPVASSPWEGSRTYEAVLRTHIGMSSQQDIRVAYPTALEGGRRADLLAQAALCACVVVYWSVLTLKILRLVPYYAGELKPIAQAGWLTMWTWIDYGHYYRYSPTGLLLVGFADRHLLAPLLHIPFPSEEFAQAKRLIPFFIASFALIALCTYRLCRLLNLGVLASFAAGMFIGLNKGFAYYFRFVSTIATSLLILYAISVLFFGIRYVRTRRPADLVGYYVSLALAVGAWEQWINLLVFLVSASIILIVRSGSGRSRPILVHGVLIPLLIGGIYVALHSRTFWQESSAVTEAQSVFSYPSAGLMIEDVAVNASLHVASIVEPLLFPWPMLSQSVLQGYDIEVYNQYNRTYTLYSAIHYRGMGDWYAGLLFGLFLCATASLAWYLSAREENPSPAVIGLLLTWAGFVMHLPIMYRTYFVLPGAASLLDYKHTLSILGASILVGWCTQKIVQHIRGRSLQVIFAVAVVSWLVYCNYAKVALTMQFRWGIFPW